MELVYDIIIGLSIALVVAFGCFIGPMLLTFRLWDREDRKERARWERR